MLKRLLMAAAMVLGCALATMGDERPDGRRADLRIGLGGSVNPAGVQNAFDVSWRRALSRSQSPLLSDAHLAAGASSRLTPAYARGGPWIELAPLSLLDVRAGVEAVGYFGTFHSLLPFDGYGDRFDDDSRQSREGARPGLGARAYLGPSLKARLGRLLFRGHAEFEWWTVRAPGPFFYEPARDTLLRSSGDALVATETILLWAFRDEGRRRLLAGPVHEMTVVYDYPDNRRQILGLVVVWGSGRRILGLAEPTVQARLARYVEDPNRKGGISFQLGISAAVGR